MRHANTPAGAGAYTNAAQVSADLAGRGLRSGARAVAVVRMHGMLLETRIKANASGRPGPNVITGDYRGSWNTQVRITPFGAVSTSGTNSPQGPRLEYGWVGTDRAGRTSFQAPLAHVGPAVQATDGPFQAAVAAIGR